MHARDKRGRRSLCGVQLQGEGDHQVLNLQPEDVDCSVRHRGLSWHPDAVFAVLFQRARSQAIFLRVLLHILDLGGLYGRGFVRWSGWRHVRWDHVGRGHRVLRVLLPSTGGTRVEREDSSDGKPLSELILIQRSTPPLHEATELRGMLVIMEVTTPRPLPSLGQGSWENWSWYGGQHPLLIGQWGSFVVIGGKTSLR